MTLTELRYILAVAQERHFGRAAEQCGVSQPSLSVAVRKLEDELNVKIFERRSSDINVTPIGSALIEQASRVLENVDRLRQIADQGRDPLSGPLRLGVIYTIAPYVIPQLVSAMHHRAHNMPLILSENFTSVLLEQLRAGVIDCAILALPLNQPGLMMQPLYDEEFIAMLPANHWLLEKEVLEREDIKSEPMLLLGNGHCFRDQVLDFCSESGRKEMRNDKSVEGTSLQTISYMVAQGLGVTILPSTAVPYYQDNPDVKFRNFARPNIPKRRVILVWRKSFPRVEAMELIRNTFGQFQLPGCKMLTSLPAVPT